MYQTVKYAEGLPAANTPMPLIERASGTGHHARCGRFFESLGYSIEEPERLMTALRAIAESGEVVENAHSIHREKYVVEGWLWAHTDGSRQRLVRTVWIVDSGREVPRLVTAHPGKE